MDSRAPAARTGQTINYVAGDDGDFRAGVAWPEPRFVDNGDGTVTDKLTGLMWTKDADFAGGTRAWNAAVDFCENLDFAGYTDWRLPNLRELWSLINAGWFDPALSDTSGTGQWSENDPFINVVSGFYWTSTTSPPDTSIAWRLTLQTGGTRRSNKLYSYPVWPVRGGR